VSKLKAQIVTEITAARIIQKRCDRAEAEVAKKDKALEEFKIKESEWAKAFAREKARSSLSAALVEEIKRLQTQCETTSPNAQQTVYVRSLERQNEELTRELAIAKETEKRLRERIARMENRSPQSPSEGLSPPRYGDGDSSELATPHRPPQPHGSWRTEPPKARVDLTTKFLPLPATDPGQKGRKDKGKEKVKE
jgi:hypothetical protein